jgi:hypothetical protein
MLDGEGKEKRDISNKSEAKLLVRLFQHGHVTLIHPVIW